MSDKEVRIRITGDASDLLKKLEAIKDVFDDLGDNRSSNRAIDNLIDGLRDVENRAEDAGDSLDNLTDATRRIDRNDGLSDMVDDLKDIDDRADEAAESLEDIAKQTRDVDTDSYDALQKQIESLYESGEKAQDVIKNINETVGDIKVADLDFGVSDKSLKDVAKSSDGIGSDIASGFVSGTVAGKIMANTMSDIASEAKDLIAALNKMDDNTPLKDKVESFDNLYEAIQKAKREVSEYEEKIASLEDELKDLNDEYFNLEAPKDDDNFDDWADYNHTLGLLEHEIKAVNEDLAEYRDRLNEAKAAQAAFEKLEQSYGDEFHNKLDDYDKLVSKVHDFINENEHAIATNERLAKTMDDVAKAFHNIYEDVNQYEFAGDIVTAEEEMKDFMKTAELVTFENLMSDLDSLGKALDDKVEKMTKLKKANSELDDQSRKYSYALEQEAKALKDYANNAGYALKVVERFDDGIEYNITGNKKVLEVDPEQLERYNRAVNEYLSLIDETNGQISKRFLGDDGKFDVNKFIDDLERYGKPLNQLIAQFKALRQQTLEYLKVQDQVGEAKGIVDYWQQVKKEAQAIKEKAEAEVKAAKTSYESYQAKQKLTEASRELAEAEEGLARAQENVIRVQEDASKTERERLSNYADSIKTVNEYAETLRKLGATVDDIGRADIESFDKSLASQLDNTFSSLFDDDIPGTLKEMIEDVKAAFAEFNNLEFGKGFDLLKDAGKGLAKNIFSKIPTAAKVAVGSITALSTAVLKLHEAGKQDFFSGLSNAANKLQPVINMLQNFGQEAVAAFEEITDSDMDLSSLMALGPNFEYQMTKVASIAGSTDKQLAELTKTAEYLGGVTQYTASDVGEAFQYMAMAGYDTEEMLSSINGVLSLSIASGTDLASTTDIVTDYMTALGMEANSTSEFVDKLAATVTSSNTTVELFGTSMKQVASQAGMLGVSMTDLSTAIGLQANAGVKGSKAGTALKNVLANLAAPTEKQAAALKQLGLSADEAGSYLKTTADGNVDLASTIKTIIKATEGMTKAQKTALIVTAMGKVAAPGILAILNQGAEAWDELSATIENSTGKIQYWNEGMRLAGKSGKEATALIEEMKTVFAEVEDDALNAGMSTEELSHAIAVLGDDGKVSSKNVKDLINVIDSMNTATGSAKDKWIELAAETKNAHLLGFDYDGTVAKLAADTQGLTQAEKEELQTRLKGVKTYKEAKEIATEYQKELNKQRGTHINLMDVVERNSLSTMSYVDKLKLLRDAWKTLGPEKFAEEMQNLGLADELDEINEVVKMSDEEFEAYTNNLETIKGMAEQLAEAMDETTKSSLLNLASAIENVAIGAFNSLKPAIQGACDAINTFFDFWHNGETNEFTFRGLEKGLSYLVNQVREAQPKVKQAVVDLFSGIDTFVNMGSLDSLLDIGTSIITGICDGIMEAKDNGTLDSAIDGAIKRICEFVKTNGDDIKEAGKTLLDSLTDGIKNNEGAIGEALDTICSTIGEWGSSSSTLKAQLGKFSETFAKLAVDSLVNAVKLKIGEAWNALFDFGNLSDPNSGGLFVSTSAFDVFFQDLIDAFGEGVDNAINAIMDLIDKLWQKIKESLNPKNWSSGKRQDSGVKPEDIFGKLPTAEECVAWVKEKLSGFNPIQVAKNYLFGETYAAEVGGGSGQSTVKPEQLIKLPSIGDIIAYIKEKLSGFNIIEHIKTALFGAAGSGGGAVTGAAGGLLMKAADLFGQWNPIEDIKGWLDEKIGDWSITQWFKEKLGGGKKEGAALEASDLIKIDTAKLAEIETQLRSLDTTASTVATNVSTAFTNITNNARTSFVNMANIVRNQMLSCANIVRNQAVNMANIFRNQFVSMANVARNQMVNVSNIVRNQAVSWSNIIRNQVQNARNALTSSFLSMAAVARTQMVNISNIVRNQAVAWSNIIRNQAANARNALTSSFMSMAAVVRNQMANCASIVRSYMSQIRAAVSQQMTMNFKVNKTITTTNVTKNVTEGLRSTMGAIGRSTASLAAPQAVTIGGQIAGSSGIAGVSGGNSIELYVPLNIDGRTMAHATAKYNEEELAKLSKRNSRRRGYSG